MTDDDVQTPETPYASEKSVRHDWRDGGRPSTAIVEAVAAVTGREPTALPPLHRSLDCGAVDALLTGCDSGDRVSVSFTYAGTAVEADSDGDIAVQVDGDRGE